MPVFPKSLGRKESFGQSKNNKKGDIKNMKVILFNQIDYGKVEGILQQERARSVNYIKSQINNML